MKVSPTGSLPGSRPGKGFVLFYKQISGQAESEEFMKKDRRQINAIWQFVNRLGEIFTFAKIGSGKNSYIKTLSYDGNIKDVQQTK